MKDNRPTYIFSVNPGRSGSEYLSALLSTVGGTVAFHEAKPKMHKDVLDSATKEGLNRTRPQRLDKITEIRRLLSESGASTYVETNHMFAKTFFDIALEELPPEPVAVVILRRPWAKVMRSFLSLGYFSDHNPVWIDWMRVPQMEGPAQDSIHPEDQMGAVAEYLLKIEQRAQEIQDWYPDIRYVDCSLEALQSHEGVTDLFDRLGFNEDTHGDLESLVGTPVNERQKKKKRLQLPTPSEQECKAFLEDYLPARADSISLNKVAL
jgi:hypothetical protein